MISFREWMNEKEGKETYKDFFNKKLEKYGVKSATELSGEDKKKFFDEVDAEWEGEKEEPEIDEKKVCNESKETEVSPEKYAIIYNLAKKIYDSNKKFQSDAKKINQWFQNETGKSNGILSQYENGVMITEKDIDWLKANSK